MSNNITYYNVHGQVTRRASLLVPSWQAALGDLYKAPRSCRDATIIIGSETRAYYRIGHTWKRRA